MNYRLKSKAMTDFEAFQLYNAIKLHFQSDSYDAIKFNFKTNVKYSSFEKRNDRYFFHKIANRYSSRDELINFYVSNFVMQNKWIGNILNDGESNYARFRRYQEAQGHFFKDDISYIAHYQESSGSPFDDLLRSIDGQYPTVITMMLEGNIRLESVVILDQLFNFITKENKHITDPVLWPQVMKRLKKYSPFIKVDGEKMMKICINTFVQ